MPRPTFWSRVDQSAGPDGCWPWTGGKLRGNCLPYGRTSMGNRGIYAHRFAYIQAHGTIPPGMQVLHSCDNPPCCNPAHLRLGTHAENMRDMVARGRAARIGGTARGERNGAARLTEAAVRDIRSEHARGVSVGALAAKHGVSKSAVEHIVARRWWAWLPDIAMADPGDHFAGMPA